MTKMSRESKEEQKQRRPLSSNGLLLFTTLLISCNVVEEEGDSTSPQQRLPRMKLPTEVKEQLISNDFLQFIENKMDSLRGTKEIPYVMLEHLSWNHKEFLNLVEKRLVTVCEHAEWHGMPRAYNLVRSLLSIQDDLQHEREVRIVQIFVEAIVHSKNISSAVTQYNLYELMTLACQNDGVLTELRSGKYTKEILPSFAKWLDVEKEEQVVPMYRDMSVHNRGVTDPPWDKVTRDCILSVIENDESIQMTGYNSDTDDPNSIVGRRISVFWSGNNAAYEGTITKFSSQGKRKGKHEGELLLLLLLSIYNFFLFFLFFLFFFF